MTKLLLTLLFGSIFITSASGQAVYDFAQGKFTAIRCAQEGQMASLRIENINTLAYKVTIKGTKGLLSTPPPAELQALFRLPDPSEKASEAAEGAKAGAEATNTMDKVKSSAPANTNFKREMTDLVVLCNDFLLKAENIIRLKQRRNELTTLAKIPWKNYAALIPHLPAPLSVSDMQGYIREFLKSYGKAEAQYNVALAAAPNDSVKKQIHEALIRFEEAYEHIDEDNLNKIVDDILVLQNALSSDFHFSAPAPSVQADDCDFVEYTLIIEPNQPDGRFAPASTMQSIPVVIPVRGGWKADFSVGLNFSFGNGAKDEQYYFTPTAEGKGRLTLATNENVVRPGVAAMLHAYRRTGRNYATGFMMGVGAGFKAENTLTASYYLGGSLVLGKKQKITLNTGVSFLSVDRLKADYQAGVEYPIESTKIPDITEKALKPSFFVGISYNVANRVVTK